MTWAQIRLIDCVCYILIWVFCLLQLWFLKSSDAVWTGTWNVDSSVGLRCSGPVWQILNFLCWCIDELKCSNILYPAMCVSVHDLRPTFIDGFETSLNLWMIIWIVRQWRLSLSRTPLSYPIMARSPVNEPVHLWEPQTSIPFWIYSPIWVNFVLDGQIESCVKHKCFPWIHSGLVAVQGLELYVVVCRSVQREQLGSCDVVETDSCHFIFYYFVLLLKLTDENIQSKNLVILSEGHVILWWWPRFGSEPLKPSSWIIICERLEPSESACGFSECPQQVSLRCSFQSPAALLWMNKLTFWRLPCLQLL